MNPGRGGVIQRRARASPNDCTFPSAASESSARCTVRWLVPSASAKAELDQDSPSTRKASTAPRSPSTGGASTTTSRARRGESANPRFVALSRPVSEGACEGAQFRFASARGAIHRRTSLRKLAQGASPLVRLPAMLRPTCAPGRITPGALRVKRLRARHGRRDDTRPRQAFSMRAIFQPVREARLAPCHSQSGALPASSG